MMGLDHEKTPKGDNPNHSASKPNCLFDQLKQIDAGVLNVGYAEAGPVNGPAIILLHGWPYDIHSYVEVTPFLVSAGYRVIIPYLRGYGTTRFLSDKTMRNGQQSVFAVDTIALMDALKIQKSRLIWQIASPKWNFDDATFNRSAEAFKNEDHVAIVIHNYRWRLGIAEGEREYDDLEMQLAKGPLITVPAITLESDANGAPHPESSAYANKFSGKYVHKVIDGGVGHNLPQEAPKAFADAIIEVDKYVN
jgi:pimeloyl-ACP methyl ester carboxylesterase